MNELENRLKELRKAKKLSQKEFAKAFNDFIKENKEFAVLDTKGKIKKISYATVSRWEVGQTPIPTKYYEALANFFGVPLSYIQGAGYSKKEIEDIILNEINLRLADYFIKSNQGKIENNNLSLALYSFINNIKHDYLKQYLSLCGESVIENHEIPILNADLEKLFREVYDFVFEQNSILSWDKDNLENKEKLDTSLFDLIAKEMSETTVSTLTTVGKWFENSYYLENIDSKNLNEADRALKHRKIPIKDLEDNLHFCMLEDLKYIYDSKSVLSSLEAYKNFIQYLISTVKSNMNSLDAESKKEDKNQQ